LLAFPTLPGLPELPMQLVTVKIEKLDDANLIEVSVHERLVGGHPSPPQ
jgi:hypothetical protein